MILPVKRIKAHDQVKVNSDRLAVERGPILYCAEGVDNAGMVLDKVIAADAEFERTSCNILGNIYPAFLVRSNSGEFKLIPYFAWAHRGDGEMQTWFLVK